MLATYIVDQVGDSGPGTLRQAILDANSSIGADRIDFSIGGGGPQTIQPLSPLPEVAESVTIDGSTQPGYVGRPLIELRGDAAGNSSGIVINGIASTIRGLAINRFSSDSGEAQVILGGAGGHALEGNYIGVDLSGDASPISAHAMDYAIIVSSPNNRVGTNGDGLNDAAEGNVVTLPDSTGLILHQSNDADNLVIAGNHLGVNAAGTALLGSSHLGIWISGAGIEGIRIGTNADGTSDGLERNLISPNNSFASILIEAASGTIIAGNFIGTDISGTQSLGTNGGSLILSAGATNTTIGTNADGIHDDAERNVISGLSGDGINLTGGAFSNTIAGNYIGVDLSGTQAIPNAAYGIRVQDGATNNTIGGTVAAAGNVISGNFNGVLLSAMGAVVQGNFIGTNAGGTQAIPNFNAGIVVRSAGDSWVGGTGTGAGNIISGNAVGILVDGGFSTQNTRIQGNFIGTTADGQSALGNAYGIRVSATDPYFVHDVLIGGSETTASNLVSGNTAAGIHITGAGVFGARIENNRIGTNLAGTAAITNVRGVIVDGGAGGVSIGAAGLGNLISGNFEQISIEGNAPNKQQGFVNGDWTPPAWQGWDTFPLPQGSGNAFWVSATNETDFDATVGEAGGTFTRSAPGPGETNEPVAYYADNQLGGVLTLDSKIHANGEINVAAIDGFDGRGGVEYFAKGNARSNQDHNALGLRILDAGSGFSGLRVFASLVLADGTVLAGSPINGPTGLEVGITYTWRVDYDPQGGSSGAGELSVEAFAAGGTSLGTSRIELNMAQRAVGASLDAFGIRAGGGAPPSNLTGIQFYIDQLDYSRMAANTISGNTIGADVDGTQALNDHTPFSAGIRIEDSAGNRIGGSAPGAGNQVVGGDNNIQLMGAATIGNVIQGNFIGVNRDGSAAITPDWFTNGPSQRGILLHVDAGQTTIGGVNPGEGNVIAGVGAAIDIYGGGVNRIAGNWIGTNAAGDAAIGNFRGVVMSDSPDNQILNNVISGNYDGILVSGSGSTDTIIQGNLIGTNAAGTDMIGNLWYGINLVGGATGTLIGGTAEADRNIVSGNLGDGIRLEGSNHRIQGNYIGTDVTGTKNFGNANSGIYTADAKDVWIGGGNAGEGNLISGNIVGILVLGAHLEGEIRQSNVRIQGNRIGITANGMAALPNFYGVRIAASGGNFVGTDGDGTNDATERNLISGNTIAQIDIFSDQTEGNVVAGNWIGLDATGLAAIAGGGGVSIINGAGRNLIGTNADGISDQHERNVIAAPTGTAVFMENTFENVVAGNWIGTNALGTGAIGSLYGITISQSSNNRIGGTSQVQRNVIGGITNYSVQIAASTGNEVLGNYLGTDISGTATLGTGLVGVIVTASGNVIGGSSPGAGNVIGGQATGVYLDGGGTTGNVVQGNFIGVGADGTTRLENQDGITLRGATGNVIGGAGLGQGNVISGSSAFGVLLLSTSGNTLQGNRIGTDAVGAAAVYNTYGIGLINDWYSVIGGSEPGAGNLISGNLVGVTLYGGLASRYTRIQGNRIGTTEDGLAALGNSYFGIDVAGLDGNRVQDLIIGGTELGEGNVIAATNGPGIRVRGTGSERVTIQGNFIGLGLDGDSPLGNAGAGIHIENSAGHLIGGGVAGARNVISTNLNAGISLSGASTIGNRIQGNYVGIDATGLVERGNRQFGIALDAGASFNFIGTDGDGVQDALEGNIVSGHTYQPQDAGIYLGIGFENVVAGNWIGTDATGTRAIPNDDGIEVFGDHMQIGTDGDGISDDLERNVISGNLSIAISIYGPAATDTAIRGNFIGTDYTGTQELGNLSHGISVVFSSRVQIGGLSLAERNIISGNQGVGISADGASDLQIQGNYIGTDVTGTLERGNQYGIRLRATPDVLIGGGLAGAGNLISGNDQGIWLQFPETTDVKIQGNRIGTNAAGTAAIANTGHGIFASASSNFVGVDGDGVNDDGEGNLISGNLDTAIFIMGNNNVIAGNLIGTDSSGTEIIGNGRAVRVLLGSNNRIGTNADGSSDLLERNIISGNLGIAVSILAEPGRPEGANHNVIAGNYIGTDITGTRMLGNASQGVSIGLAYQGDVLAPPTGNIIGGRTPLERNLIAGSGGFGLYMERAEETLVLGNYIGTDVTGSIAFPNATGAPGGPPAGILVWRSARNQIGDGTPGGGNLISGNIGYGLQIWAAGSDDNRVQGNFIGTNAAGTAALGNTGGGISSGFGAIRTIIGTDGDGTFDATEGNLVSGDPTWVGIGIDGEGSVVAGNKVGTDLAGLVAIPNAFGIFVGGSGIRVGTNADGSSDELERNIIAGNLYAGVSFSSNDGLTGNTFAGNYVGVNRIGAALGNGGGIEIRNSNANLIGSNADGVRDDVERNVIAANHSFGIAISGSAGSQSSGNIIAGNFIGTGPDGLSDRGNATYGVDLTAGSQGTTVGGATEATRNVISGNGRDGIRIADSSDHRVLGNYIGVDRTGAAALPNEQGGIQIYSYYYTGLAGQLTTGNQIGGSAPNEGNLISGNDGYGVTIIGDFATGNFVQGNLIGTNASGSSALGNRWGVWLDSGAHDNSIGGAEEGAGNVISGNLSTGVYLEDLETTNNLIVGNLIGLNATGTSRVGNVDGIAVSNASGNQIGGPAPGERNVISGNTRFAVVLSSLAGNTIQGNFVGTDVAGSTTRDVGNFHNLYLNGDANSLIGGTEPGEGNIIANGIMGIWLDGTPSNRFTTGTRIQGNRIGTDATGAHAFGNSYGIYVDGRDIHEVHDITIGGTSAGASNLIAGNTYGVSIIGQGAKDIHVQGNLIGTDASGLNILKNQENVWIENAAGVHVGGTAPGARNVISGGNTNITLKGAAATGAIIQGNYIGLDVTGDQALPSDGSPYTNYFAIYVYEDSGGHQIGGLEPGAGNVIGGHVSAAVVINGSGGNLIAGNRIGTNAAGDAAVGNAGGISVGAAPNNTIARNLISGNYRGISLYGTEASNQRIVGNFIGTNALGDAPIPNSNGIYVENAPAVTIGGTAVGDGNLISGNSRGIDLYGAHGTVVQGNLIGTNLAGTEAIPGAGYGIHAFDTADMLIGGSVTGARNVIAGQINAVIIVGPASRNNRFQGNYVGTNAAGTAVLSNQAGVSIGGGAAFNTVGTDGDGVGDAGEGNLISGNPLWGVSLGGNANDNVVAGNLVGTDRTGTIALPFFGGIGVSYSGSRNRIGTNADGISDALERNIIVGGVGLFLDPLVPSVMEDNVIKGNYIGTDVTGTTAFGVAQSGIRLGFSRAADSPETEGPVRTIIGGTTEVERNIIAGFSQFGILGDRAVDTVIQGNYIGTDVTGTQDRGNGTGIQLYNSPGTVIGGGQPGAGNLISGNEYGITIGYPQTIHSRIQGNKIGTDVTGTRVLANTYTGIGIYNGGSDNVIGVDGDGLNDAGEGNLVSGNPYQAIAIQGDRNVVAGNLIGTDHRGEEIIGNGHAVTIGLGSYNLVGTNADGVSDELERNVISGNTGAGVAISASPDRLERTDHNVVAGNYIGTDITGTRMLGNGWHGVVLSFTHYGDFLAPPTGNTIGGRTPVERNIIAGSGDYGIFLGYAEETLVAGNYIGTDVTGSVAFPNALDLSTLAAGVMIWQGKRNDIGGGETGAGNVISGNNGSGVAILYGGADNNRVQGNLIGTDASGSFAVPNTHGVWTGPGTVGNIIGVDGDGVHDENEGNVISGHASSESANSVGVILQGSHDVLAGNKIGTDITGTRAIPNSFGVGAYAFDSLIGTNADGVSDELERNLIAGNLNFGLHLNYGASRNVVAGNWIGLDASGQALGNGGGINLTYGSQGVPRNNLIGSNADGVRDEAERNVISGNDDFGIRITGWAADADSSSNNVVAGNFIGTDPSGTRAQPNRLVSTVNMGDGIQVWNGASGITVGGTHPAARNVISGNEGSGIDIDQSSEIIIRGNFIGTDHTGTIALANQADGISVTSRSSSGPSTGTIIGGVEPGAGNLISGNSANGINLLGSRTNFTQIAGNLIGVDVTGNLSLSNRIGVRIEQGASNNLIGGTLGGASNVISGNRDAGVHIVGADVANNVVQRNFIGTDRSSRRGLANQHGIIVQQSASTTIGGELPELGNTIAYNSSAGIWLVDSPAGSAETRNNRMFYNGGLGIDLGALGPTLNDPGDVDGLLNFPVITSAVIAEFALTISGFARPGVEIDFYRSVPTLNGMGQGDVLLASFREGSLQDSDIEAGSYGPNVRGLPVGSDSTNRFRFSIPRSLLPNDVNFGSLLTAVAVGSTSEFSQSIPIGDVQTGMAPVVDVGGDQVVNQGQWLVINGAFTDDDSTSWSATVDYGDGTVEPLALRADRSFTLQHQYALAGQHLVTVWVVDNSQMVGSDQLQVTVVNEAPTATFNFFTITSPATEGSTITLRGEFTDPGLNDIHQVEIDWGDNSPIQFQMIPLGERRFEVTHVFVDDDPTGTPRDVYRVQVTVVDSFGGRDSTPLGLFLEDVINVAPNNFMVAPSALLIDENEFGFSLSGSFFDPGVLDTHQVTIDWGDNSPKETIDLSLGDRIFSDVVHVYRDNPDTLDSQYLIRVEVADDDEPLRPAVATVPVTVRNVLPHSLAVSASATTINENDTIQLSGSFLDPGPLDTHRIEIDWGDGSTEVITLSAGENSFSNIPHQYRDNAVGGGAYTLSVRVFDDDQPSVSVATTAVVAVNNLPPTLTGITSDIHGVLREGDWVTVSGSYADKGSSDRHTVEVFWSDGTSSIASVDSTSRSFVATHQLIDDNPTGTPLDATHVRIVITDDDGDTAEQLLPISIANVPPTVDIRPGANSTQALVELIADVQDPGVADSFTYQWEITVAGNTVSTLGGPIYVLDRTGNFNDVFVVRLTVRDDDTGSTTLTTALKVGTPLSDNIVVTDIDFSALGVNDMIVLGLESSDVIDATAVSAGNRVRLDGGTGNDRLFGGAGDDVYFLRGGDDSANPTTVVGDPAPVYAGADRYFLVPNSTQRVADYEGVNAVDFSLADFGVTFDLSARGVVQDVDPTGDAATHFVFVEGSFGELVGSAFDDTLTADANAALWAGDGADLLKIESDAINNVSLAGGDGDDRFLLSGSNLSNIRARGDDGADLMIVEGTLDDLVFTGGADDDEVRLMTAAVVSSFEFRGDDGADLVIVEGTLDDLVFTGGADDDEVRLLTTAVVSSFEFRGDDGADLVIVEGTLDDLVFTGGADGDQLHLIVSSAVSLIRFRGDDGADLMIVEGTLDDLVFTGGADDDEVRLLTTAVVSSFEFRGDDGADLVIVEGTLDDLVFTGGADDDELRVISSGQNIRFQGDDGADLVIIEGTLEDLVFTGGADGDQLQLLDSSVVSSIQFQGDDGADLMIVEGTLDDLVFTGGADDDLLRTTAMSHVQKVLYRGDDGADLMIVEGTLDDMVFTGGADNDYLRTLPSASLRSINFRGDDGADLMIVEGSLDDLVFTGGADDDRLRITTTSTAHTAVFQGDDGADLMIVEGTLDDLVFTGGADNDRLLMSVTSRSQTIAFNGDDGADLVIIEGTLDDLVFSGGADNDQLLIEPSARISRVQYFGDDGADLMIVEGLLDDVVFTGGADQDRLITLTGGQGAIDFYGESASAVGDPNAARDVLVNLGNGWNAIRLHAAANGSVLQNRGNQIGVLELLGGQGPDALVNYGSQTSQIIMQAGAGSDLLINDAANVASILFEADGYSGEKTLINYGNYSGTQQASIVFRGGHQIDAFQNNGVGYTVLSMYGGTGGDTFQNNAAGITELFFDGDEGSDVLENNGAGVQSILFEGGQGDDIFANDGANVAQMTFWSGDGKGSLINTGSETRQLTYYGSAGQDTLINQGQNAANIVMFGGAGDDRLFNLASGASQLTMFGDEGDDAFYNLATATDTEHITFAGGQGNNRLINQASQVNGLTFTAEDGDDLFQSSGSAITNIQISWGDGANTLHLAGSDISQISLLGGQGNDTVVIDADALHTMDFIGNDGNDLLLLNGDHAADILFHGGSGHDSVAVNGRWGRDINFHGEDGQDRLQILGTELQSLSFFGGAGDDAAQLSGASAVQFFMSGDDGNDLLFLLGDDLQAAEFVGGPGLDTLISSGNRIGSLRFDGGSDADTLRTAGVDLQELTFLGGSGSDGLVMNHVSGTASIVRFDGGLGDEMVAIRGRADRIELELGEGNDLVLHSGDGHLKVSGGAGDDHYVLAGAPTGSMYIDEIFSGISDDSRDLIDLSGLSPPRSSNELGIRLDLIDTAIQQLMDGFTLKLSDSNGIEDVTGTLGADTILGNDRDNHINGAQYQHLLPSTGTLPKRNQTQWVLLDFDTYSQPELGEYSYSEDDRQAIAERMSAAFRESGGSSAWLDIRIALEPEYVPIDVDYATIYFNQTPSFGRPGGEASEIDFLNRNLGGFAVVQINGLLGGLEAAVAPNEDFIEQLPEDADLAAVGSSKPLATRENILALSAKIATHELGHLLGLMHADAFGPIGFGIHAPPGALVFTPEIFGPAVAFETLEHLIGSPGSIGSTRFNDVGQLFFGEREAIKLALTAAQITSLVTPETGGDHGIRETAQPLQLKSLPVPKLSRVGLNASKVWDVRTAVVAGTIDLQNQTSQSDLYAIEGTAGQVLSIEVFSQTLGHLQGDTIDPVVRLYDEAGQLVAYFDGVAVNDDQFEGSESRLIDVRLPSDGVYYIEVDTFRRSSEDPLCQDLSAQHGELYDRLLAACTDQDTGGYELLIYSFATYNGEDGIDTLHGRGGVDVLNGGPNDDYELRVQLPNEVSAEEGITLDLVGAIEDRGGQSWSGRVNFGDGTGWHELLVNGTRIFSLAHSYQDNGTFYLTVQVNNDDQLGFISTTIVQVVNVAPVLGEIIAPTEPVLVTTPVSTDLNFTDAGLDDSHVMQWNWGDGVVSVGTVTGAGGKYLARGNHTYSLPGIYRLTVVVTDDDGAVSHKYYEYIVVVGQSGSVTGAATFEIPAAVQGTATPTLVQMSTSVHSSSDGLSGQFRLRLLQENTLFVSTQLRWLVVNGSTATYSGNGLLDGVAGYSFIVSVFDGGKTGQPDRVRVKIWKELTGEVWLDTQIGAPDIAAPLQELRSGNLVVRQ